MRRYTIAEAHVILSHVFCVHHLPSGDGFIYRWAPGAGEPLCSRCPCRNTADLRLYVPSRLEALAWLEKENAAIDAFNAKARAA